MYSEVWKKDVDEKLFWSTIDLANRDKKSFLEKVESFDRKTLIWFSWYYESLASELGQEKFMEHADPSYSEDSLDDLWDEVVGKGKEFYSSVIKNPKMLPKKTDYAHPSHTIRSALSNVFYKRYDEEIPPNSYDY